MAIEYENRKEQIFYLHEGKTKTGKAKYFFSLKKEGDLVETIPEGFEIYENPQAQVFLRKILPKLITDEEIRVVEKGLEKYSELKKCIIDVRKEVITIFVSSRELNPFEIRDEALSRFLNLDEVEKQLEQNAHYTPLLQFVLTDKDQRIFTAQRFCFLGSIDNWINIGNSQPLSQLVKQYLKHLGQDSFFEFF